MRKQRLLKLADYLETKVPTEQFDMNLWASRNFANRHACGTSACALGWACTIPSFKRAGLKFGFTGDGHPYPILEGFATNNPIEAAELFFDLDAKDAAGIFFGGEATPQVVARRIRKLVARG